MALASFALAALLVAGAQNSQDSDKNRIVAPPASDGGGNTAKATPTRYCVVSTPTGTRMARKECHTRAEWLDRDFDPLAPQG